jgi:hypothetical protein
MEDVEDIRAAAGGDAPSSVGGGPQKGRQRMQLPPHWWLVAQASAELASPRAWARAPPGDAPDDEGASLKGVKATEPLADARDAPVLALEHLDERAAVAVLAVRLAVHAARLGPIDHSGRVVNEDGGKSARQLDAATAAQQPLVEDVVRHDEQQRFVLATLGGANTFARGTARVHWSCGAGLGGHSPSGTWSAQQGCWRRGRASTRTPRTTQTRRPSRRRSACGSRLRGGGRRGRG